MTTPGRPHGRSTARAAIIIRNLATIEALVRCNRDLAIPLGDDTPDPALAPLTNQNISGTRYTHVTYKNLGPRCAGA